MVGRRRLSGAFLIDINRIEPDPDQPRKRIDPTHLQELAKSVKRLGVLQPITVRYIEESDMYRIIAGECRYTASKNAGLGEVPCWVKDPKADEILLEQIVENWQRSDLNPFELADSLAQLKASNGLNQSDLAKSTGKNKSEISRLLSLLELDPDVQKIARDDTSGRITKRHLFAVARLDADRQKKLVKRIKNDNLTALDVERVVARIDNPKTSSKPAGAPWTRRKYQTTHASVVLTFRKRDVSDDDVVKVIDELRSQIAEDS